LSIESKETSRVDERGPTAIEKLPSLKRPGLGVDWTEGSIPVNLIKLSWPMIVGSSLNMLGPTIDVMWVGKLGEAAVAGVGVAGIAIQMVMSAMMGMATGMRAMIARFIGSGDLRNSESVAIQAMIFNGIVSVILAAAGYLLAEPILKLMGLEEEVVRDGAAYLRVVCLSAIPMSLRFMCEGSMQAAGDSFRPMTITVVYRIFHIALCPFLVFGWWIFPRLGVVGAGATNIASQTLGLSISLWVLFSGRTRLRLMLKGIRIDWAVIWRIVKIGIPSSVMGVQMTMGAFVLIKLISPYGTTAVAGHTIWQRIDMLLMMPIMGLGMGAGVLAGQNLGAGKPERAVRSGWIAAFLAEGFMLVWVMVILLFAENIVRLFNSDPGLVYTGAAFLRIACAYYAIFAFSPVFQYCISGSGDTMPPMILSIVGTWVFQLPLAFFLPHITDWGVYGIRWAMAINAILGTSGFVLYYISGRWKKKML